ncbi:SdiA-regulated domain-containing protein [Escherichia coli]|uniref:SdiA-regulated domain-containing protein n=4 Tax=Escherichia coli TaxID=562 RepID=A0AAW5YZE7_ECOLX|nr:SdiA-regulated domain-containing protein [Escherichia coli]MCT9734501.1 SdiA-regulated domain-containing protein [Escherichia coli]MDA4175885.1 SdiA-regulated domain-containing protein [Escherichia coli]MED8190988.1 SdiA-regulated domain-containing protein [Escherichia coli]
MFGEYTNPVNKGLEGLTWDGNKQNLFAAKEMKDVIITRANMISNDMGIDKIIDPVAKSLRKVRISRSFLPKLTR